MDKVVTKLFELQDLKYRDFHANLIPGYEKNRIIGVRMPELRKFAKEFSKDPDKQKFLGELPHYYYEENNLHAAIVGNSTNNIDEMLKEVEKFLPYVNNWATCDMFSVKLFKKYPDIVYDKTLEWMKSIHTYTVRYGIVTQLSLFMDEQFRPEMLDIMAKIDSQEYYINMAIAWYYSYALIKQYEKTIPLFEKKTLEPWIHNKSIQKAIESYRVTSDRKNYLKSLKVKTK